MPRPKGSPNKITAEIKNIIKKLFKLTKLLTQQVAEMLFKQLLALNG